jgi:putative endonuclease
MWVIYILQLSDDSLYCGITNDIDRRIFEHAKKRGSKYVASRLPIKDVVYIEEVETKSEALKREATIKKMSRKEKERLCRDQKKKTI